MSEAISIGERFGLDVKYQHGVKSRGSQIESTVVNEYLVTVLQIRVSIGLKASELTAIHKDLVTCCQIDLITVQGDSAETSIAAPAFPIDCLRVPIE
jgi:hypothetical protein